MMAHKTRTTKPYRGIVTSERSADWLRPTLASRGGKATANSSVILVLSSSWVFFSLAVIT